MNGVKPLAELARPFTLLAPALGFASGAVTAAGADPREPVTATLWLYPAIGVLMSVVLNAASNGLNQIYDSEIDAINKPGRPLPSGRLSRRTAWYFVAGAYLLALVLAWMVAPGGRRECFWIVVAAAVMTVIYSVPPIRTKRLGLWANLTIAVPRGVLLKAAGWSDDQIQPEYPITDGRIISVGSKHRRGHALRDDYMPEHQPGLPIAVVEAERDHAMLVKACSRPRATHGSSTFPSRIRRTAKGSSRTIATAA